MSKPYSGDDLSRQLNQDITWRIREISDLKTAVWNADKVAKSALLRAVVALSYAHWEGHIRFSAQKFLAHIALRKFRFSALKRQFLRNHFLPRLAAIGHKPVEERGNIIDAVLDAGDDRFTRVNDDLINTRSNLNSEALKEICQVCDVCFSLFYGKENFIDIILLKRRNAIAHGEDTFIQENELDNITDETIALMRIFSNELQAKAYLQTYKAT